MIDQPHSVLNTTVPVELLNELNLVNGDSRGKIRSLSSELCICTFPSICAFSLPSLIPPTSWEEGENQSNIFRTE